MEIFIGILKIIGIFLFLYLTWRNLHDDYEGNLLISYSWLAILAGTVGGRLVYGLLNWGVFPNIWNWFQIWQKPGLSVVGVLMGVILISWFYCRENNWKLWSFFEDMTPIFYLLGIFLLKGNWVMIVGFVLAIVLSNKYRSFVWYKSGKKGFVFFFVNIVTSLIMAGMSIALKDRWFVSVLYLAISLISLTELFILGEVFNNFSFKRKTNVSNNT